MWRHVAGIVLCLAVLPHEIFSKPFFWKVRLIYSTLDPEPSWPKEMLEWNAEQRQWRKDVSAGKITGFHNEGFYTTSVSEHQWHLKCREEYVQECTDRAVYNDRMMVYVKDVFLQPLNILGHMSERYKNLVRLAKDWLMAHVFLRDPKAVKSMLNLVETRKFYNERDKEYIRERWVDLWSDIKIYKTMMTRINNAYLKFHYPDGYIRTHINNWLGIKNELLEKAQKERTTIKTKPTTTIIRDEEWLYHYKPEAYEQL
uniref:Uncharacterized protein n=1 Tax=Cacopsylla melanoneura TaxID=428564 RepID=A0A8D9EY54_9HEMI